MKTEMPWMEALWASRVFSVVLCARWTSEKRIEMSRIEVIAWWIGASCFITRLSRWRRRRRRRREGWEEGWYLCS